MLDKIPQKSKLMLINGEEFDETRWTESINSSKPFKIDIQTDKKCVTFVKISGQQDKIFFSKIIPHMAVNIFL